VPQEHWAQLHIQVAHSQERLRTQERWVLHNWAASWRDSPRVPLDIHRVRRDNRVGHQRWLWVRKVEEPLEQLPLEHRV